MGYIYKVTNTVNGHMYIGQTRRTIEKRWRDHKARSKCKKLKSRCLLYDAMKKYGVDAFIVEELEQCDNDLLNEREIYWIAHYDTVRNGYNISCGGGNLPHSITPVAQFDMDGNYIKTFPSVAEAAEEVNSLPQGIYSACDGYYASRRGYQWRYLSDAEKCGMKLSKVKQQPLIRPVHQYTMDGDYVASYNSISEAMYQFGARGTGGIRSVCTGRNRHSHGYRWSYEKVEKLGSIEDDKGLRPVVQMDTNGNVIKVYSKMKDAAKEHNITVGSIWAVCNGKHSCAKGYKWKYLNKEKVS